MDFNIKIGQLLPLERKILYEFVLKTKPNIVLEVGSGAGGASYHILRALRQNKHGRLYSCDPRTKPSSIIYNFFSEILSFSKVKSLELIERLIKENIIPDFIFFDGPEDPQIALDDFKTLDKYLKPGAIFSMHDWCTEKRMFDDGISTKALLLKPYLKSLKNWEVILELDGKESKDTVGMVFAKKLSK